MRFGYAESFQKMVGSLDRHQAQRLLNAIAKFEAAWEARRFPKGLGLMHLRENFNEFRVGIHEQVLFKRSGDAVLYLFYGSHNDIRHFLKSI